MLNTQLGLDKFLTQAHRNQFQLQLKNVQNVAVPHHTHAIQPITVK